MRIEIALNQCKKNEPRVSRAESPCDGVNEEVLYRCGSYRFACDSRARAPRDNHGPIRLAARPSLGAQQRLADL